MSLLDGGTKPNLAKLTLARQRAPHNPPPWRGGEPYAVARLPKLKREVVGKAANTEKVIEAIRGAARTGNIGDGKLFVTAIEDAVRLRTGERGDTAI